MKDKEIMHIFRFILRVLNLNEKKFGLIIFEDETDSYGCSTPFSDIDYAIGCVLNNVKGIDSTNFKFSKANEKEYKEGEQFYWIAISRKLENERVSYLENLVIVMIHEIVHSIQWNIEPHKTPEHRGQIWTFFCDRFGIDYILGRNITGGKALKIFEHLKKRYNTE